MSEFGVYEDEMLKKFSDQEIDCLLSGNTPESEELARLAPILLALHQQTALPSENRVAAFAAEAAALARSARPKQSATPGRTLTRPRRFALALRQKMATGLTAALLLSGLTGVAVASNDAAPGDPLFGVDQLLEDIGIGDGEAAERIAEAQELFKRGQVAEAIGHAAQAVEVTEGGVVVFSPESANASTALEQAAAKVASGGDADSANASVADMLEEMALMMQNPDFDGRDFGTAVAEMARGIGGDNGDAGDNGADNAAAGSENAEDGLDTAVEASENSEEGPDTADEASENSDEGLDTADDATGGDRPNRP